MKAFEAGDLDEARKEQDKSIAMIDVLKEFGVIRSVKEIMRFMGVDCGPCRSPISPMGAEESATFFDRLKPMDVFARPLSKP